MRLLRRKLLRAMPLWACGPRCSGPPSYFSRTISYSHAVVMPGRAVFAPLQLLQNQCSRKAKIMFETSRTTSNVVSLMSYVSIPECGTIFREWGMPFSDKLKNADVSYHEITSARMGCDNFHMCKSCAASRVLSWEYEMRDGALRRS